MKRSDPEDIRRWRREAAQRYQERVREEVLRGERAWNSVPPVNRERQAKEWERAYHSEERVEWIKRQPSVVSGRTPCVNAHVPPKYDSSGMGRKADHHWVVPLTLDEEKELHRIGRETFEAKHDVDLAIAATAIEERWERYEQEAA